MKKTEKIVLGLVAAAALVLSAGVVYGAAAQPQARQYGSAGGMMGGTYTGGMMGGMAPPGMMGTSPYGMMTAMGAMMDRMADFMGGIWNQTRFHPSLGGYGYVAIIGTAFHPANLTVVTGATVTWVNMDFVQHTVNSGREGAPNGVFTSLPMGHMQAYSYTFQAPGTYPYYCDIHPNMTGFVTVTG